MAKTETIHIRVLPEIKKESEAIFNELGVNTSYAVSMFLKQVIDKRAIPFNIALKSNDEIKREEELVEAISLTGGVKLNMRLKKIIHLYAIGDIDYETACFAIRRNYK